MGPRHEPINRMVRPMESPGPATESGLALTCYRALTSLARPAAGLILHLRAQRGKEDPARRGERLGEPAAARPAGAVVWFHAASVGETNAVLPLIAALLAMPPAAVRAVHDRHCHVGAACRRPSAGRRHPPIRAAGCARVRPPVSRPLASRSCRVHRAGDLAQPGAGERCARHSAGSRQCAHVASVFRAVAAAAGVCARAVLALRPRAGAERVLARQFAALGAPRALAAGNLKIDAPPPPVDAAELRRLQTALAGRPRFVAASTHDGEEAIVAAAHRTLARSLEGFATILAPRHPERGAAVAELLRAQGLSVAQPLAGRAAGPAHRYLCRRHHRRAGHALRAGADRLRRRIAGRQGRAEPDRGHSSWRRRGNRSQLVQFCRCLWRAAGARRPREVRSADALARACWLLRADPAELSACASRRRGLAIAVRRAAATLEALLPLLPSDEGLKRAS